MSKSKKTEADQWIALISARLREMRKSKGYSSYETFALDNNLDRKQYWRVENGANITIKTLVKILDIHNKDLPGFFKGLDNGKKR